MLILHLIGQGELFAQGACSEVPKVVWAILFGYLTDGIGMAETEFLEQLVRTSAIVIGLSGGT